jgi:hypothetical protein
LIERIAVNYGDYHRRRLGKNIEGAHAHPKEMARGYGGAQMHYKPCIEIIGGARALLPMEVYTYGDYRVDICSRM